MHNLFTKIKEAFKNVELGNGVGLLETEVIDDYGTNAERQKARAKDEKYNWTKLIDNEYLKLFFGYGGLSFFDAEGLRFHLPAYMCTTLQNPELDITESLIHCLTNLEKFNRERFQLLNHQQKAVICEFLQYVLENNSWNTDVWETEFDKPLIKTAIEDYWSKNI